MLNVAIVDDDASVSEQLEAFVRKYFSETSTTGSATDADSYNVDCFSDGVEFLSCSFNDYDIVFMDICMPIKDGLEVAREFRKKNETACLIFVTNLAEMAIKGYEVDALDFVVKPVDYGDFKYRMSKAVKRAKLNFKDCIAVMSNRLPVKISINSIIYVETISHRVIYHTLAGEVEEWGTMKEAESKLLNYNFSKCNSGYLVNLRFVESVNGSQLLIDGKQLMISRNRRTQFMNDMMRFFGGGGSI